MLERYDGKPVRITAMDGTVFTGEAEHYASGYGLEVFDWEEESLRVGDTHLFSSEIRRIEVLEPEESPAPQNTLDPLMARLLEGPYRVVDILPEQVPSDSEGQYFAVERYFLGSRRLRSLRRRWAELLLKLNCYDEMTVSFDGCVSWTQDPDPEGFADRVETMAVNDFLRAVFPRREVMVDLEPSFTFLTVYGTDRSLLRRLDRLAAAEGFFVWSPE